MRQFRQIILYGMMGVGKSTLGPLLARELDLPFHDLDRHIEVTAGATITEIFQFRGESEFRRLEISAAKTLAREPASVIAAGGGTIANRDAFLALNVFGLGIHLEGDPEILLQRSTAGGGHRPLLRGEAPATLFHRLFQERAPLLHQLPLRLTTTTGDSPEVVAHKLGCMVKTATFLANRAI